MIGVNCNAEWEEKLYKNKNRYLSTAQNIRMKSNDKFSGLENIDMSQPTASSNQIFNQVAAQRYYQNANNIQNYNF